MVQSSVPSCSLPAPAGAVANTVVARAAAQASFLIMGGSFRKSLRSNGWVARPFRRNLGANMARLKGLLQRLTCGCRIGGDLRRRVSFWTREMTPQRLAGLLKDLS